MGKQKKKQKKRGNPLWTLVFLAALAVFCFSGYKLIGIYLDYKTGTDEYRDLQQYTTEITKTPETPAPTKTEEPQAESEPAEPSEPEPEPLSYPTEPPLAVDFESLKAINPDVKGWLYIEALDISYPVVQGPDNDTYLHTTYEGTSNFAGSIFLDYQNQDDFSDGNTIVYGHNMKNLSMFGKLKQMKEQEKSGTHRLIPASASRNRRCPYIFPAPSSVSIFRTWRDSSYYDRKRLVRRRNDRWKRKEKSKNCRD